MDKKTSLRYDKVFSDRKKELKEKNFKQTAADNNSITLLEVNPEPSNTMFYATKLKIDIAAKIVYKAFYEADTKKWTPLEKEQNGTDVFLVIK